MRKKILVLGLLFCSGCAALGTPQSVKTIKDAQNFLQSPTVHSVFTALPFGEPAWLGLTAALGVVAGVQKRQKSKQRKAMKAMTQATDSLKKKVQDVDLKDWKTETKNLYDAHGVTQTVEEVRQSGST